ncbi:MAG: hypothetical protein ABH830_01040 [Patescibacteria group bacterium]
MIEKFETTTKEKPKRPENYFEELNNLLKQISEEINNNLKEQQEDDTKLVNDDCSINMGDFTKVHQAEKIDRDEKYVKEQIKRFAPDPKNKSVQTFYKTTDENKIIKAWQENKKRSDGSLTEMAITSILYKFLKDKFVVVRSSKFDDYHNGVDNLIVDKETGEVICAFDAIRIGDSDNDKIRFRDKIMRISDKISEGGINVDYGLTYTKDNEKNEMKLTKTALKNVPIFCFGLFKEELSKLLSEMNYDINTKPNEAELNIFKKLMKNLDGQKNFQLKNNALKPDMREKMEKLSGFIDKMRLAGLESK